MEIFKHRLFHNWAESEGLTDQNLAEAVTEISQGLFEAHLSSRQKIFWRWMKLRSISCSGITS